MSDVPDIIAATNPNRAAHFHPMDAAEMAQVVIQYPTDRCEVDDKRIFGATADEVFPFFLRIIPKDSGAPMEYDVRLEWFSAGIPKVAKLWRTAAAEILNHPHVKAVMTRNGWPTAETDPMPEPLQLIDGKGGFFGDPHVHFSNGNLLVWWQINSPGVFPRFFHL